MPAETDLKKSCPHCFNEFRSDRFKIHLPICELRLVKCIWGCGDKLYYKEYKRHEKHCKEYALKECEKHLKKIRIREGACRHCYLPRRFPHFEATCQQRILFCYRCRQGYKACDINAHIGNCKKLNTRYCPELRQFVSEKKKARRELLVSSMGKGKGG